MKKFLTLILLATLFVSCSSSDDDNEPNIPPIEKPQSIVGVWENGNNFISFNSDEFYSAYIADEFIDSGNYTRVENVVSCENTYFSRKTTYTIKSISDTKLSVDISYTDLDGKVNKKTIEFTKSKTTPASKSNTLVGKSYTSLSQYFGNVTMTFSTYNSGMKSASKGSAEKYPLKFFYIYIGNKLYFQILDDSSIQVPSIGAWTTDYNTVKCWELEISSNGSINIANIIQL